MTKTSKTRPAAKAAAKTAARATAPIVSSSTSMSGGAAIVGQLIANGIDTVFGLPGVQMYPFFDALQQRSDAIRTFGARHEQGTAYMAFGAARSTGKPAVCSVVPGPGLLNTTAALATAMGACAPVLCITGQAPSQFIGRGRGHLHELSDSLGVMNRIVKWAARIERPADAPAIINEAFRQMLSGRPGPVVVEMAWDTMASEEPVTLLPPAKIDVPLPANPASIEAAAKLLAHAKHPIIFLGSGAQHASAEVLALAEALEAPVTAFRGGRGIVAEDHPLSISCAAAMRHWPQCDALIGIGTRLELPYMRWAGMMTLIDKPVAPPHLIRIDIDPVEMTRLVPHAGIIADAAEGAAKLCDAVKRLRPKSDGARARAQLREVREATRTAIQKIQPQMSYLEVIREVLPRDGLFVEELCQAGFTSAYGFPVYKPRSYVSCGFQGTLGYGFPTALGVKAVHPDTPVVSITGDGGFMFAVQEMATAAQDNIALVTILFNNRSFGNVLRDQKQRFGNRVIGAALDNPDFQMLAKSFNVDSALVRSPEELRPALKRAIASRKPTLIEVDIPQGSEASPWEFLMPQRPAT